MNKRLIIFLIAFFSLAFFVSASMTPYSRDGFNHDVEVYLEKGWNLILAPDLTFGEAIMPNSDIKKEDIKISYFYIPELKEYYEFYPNNEKLQKVMYQISQNARDFFQISAVWVYSNKAGYFRYKRVDVPKFDQVKLSKGWNFITFTPEIEGKYIKDIKGDCNILKAYGWSPKDKKWVSIMDISFDDEGIGYGFVVKVDKSCSLEDEAIVSKSLILKDYGTDVLVDSREEDETCNSEGNFCYSSLRLEYKDEATNKVIFLSFMDITKGTKSWVKSYYAKEMGGDLETISVRSNKLYRLEPHELFWFVNDKKVDMIFVQEGKEILQKDGSYTMSYGNATGNDAITAYWLSEYPSVEVKWPE